MSDKKPANQKEVVVGNRCGCGRSPNGVCVGWHALSIKDYEDIKEKYETGKCDLRGNEIK